MADLYDQDCHQDAHGTAPDACTFGDPASGTVVALVGDSHAGQWQPPLAQIAQAEGWRLDTYTKGSCGLTSARTWLGTTDAPYTACGEWNDAVLAHLLADPPDVVVVSSNRAEVVGADDERLTGASEDRAAVAGLTASWSRLQAAGVPVVVLGDTPWVGVDVPECVAQHTDDWSTACTLPVDVPARRSGVAQQRAAADALGLPMLDVTDLMCPDGTCPPIIGGVLVWRDADHVTASYARSLVPELRDWLAPLVTGR
ncbi:SGNH hydrolase domain-containing protein [Cellulomonas sp.]|uniref:SGNH hydrolase domain-containing protein n=1 Tax=Cellulomonas sp. TaxID=40001 RepID=UPI00258F59A3|nr:SGNH hydrolase domain-containing protein [Cellulomonas sp.]MCR6689491.1 hypothetical protein [Cellulomonas sp.]